MSPSVKRRTSALFPTPDAPTTSTLAACPARVAANASPISPSSRSLPTKRAAPSGAGAGATSLAAATPRRRRISAPRG